MRDPDDGAAEAGRRDTGGVAEVSTGIPPSTRFAVIDVETTGLRPEESNVVEVAIIELDASGAACSEWSTLINPPGSGPLGATQIHGITRAMVADAPTFETIADQILERLTERVIVGHVIEFDISHLTREFERALVPLPDLRTTAICTRDLARRYPLVAPLTLANCCAQLGIEAHDAHSALGDTRATVELLRFFLPGLARETTVSTIAARVGLLGWSVPLFPTGSAQPKPRPSAT
jgi:DNA polymerase-3 subunit epsilon